MTERLMRNRREGVVFGVCAGLGDYFRVDPVVFRIGFVVLTLAGGSGVIAYAIAWLIMPAGPDEPAIGARLTRGSGLLRILFISIAAIALLNALFHEHFDGGFVVALVVLGIAAIALNRRGDDMLESGPQAEAPAGPPPPDAPDAPTPCGPHFGRRDRHRGPSVTKLTLSLVLLVLGVGWLAEEADAIDLTLQGVLAAALIVVGGGLVAGSFLGRGRRLIFWGVSLTTITALASTADVSFGGGFGDRTIRPASITELESRYRLTAGEMLVDLTEMDWSGEQAELVVSVGAGKVLVIVPGDIDVDVDARSGAGTVTLFGHEDEGLDVEQSSRQDGSGELSGELELTVRAGLGEVEVRSD